MKGTQLPPIQRTRFALQNLAIQHLKLKVTTKGYKSKEIVIRHHPHRAVAVKELGKLDDSQIYRVASENLPHAEFTSNSGVLTPHLD